MIVKICGITTIDDARAAIELGATMIGFVFAPSPRRIDPQAAGEIVRSLTKENISHNVQFAGVFVNETKHNVEAIVREAKIDYAQIHGDENAEYCNKLNIHWYRALRIVKEEDVSSKIRNLQCDRVLIDAAVNGSYGGTGITIDTDTARDAVRIIKSAGKKAIVAGGINPLNVGKVIQEICPDGLDISSGVEESPGKKSVEKMWMLFNEISHYKRTI